MYLIFQHFGLITDKSLFNLNRKVGDNSKNRLQNLYGYSYQNINNASQKLRSENNNLTVAKNVIDISSQRHDKVFFFA